MITSIVRSDVLLQVYGYEGRSVMPAAYPDLPAGGTDSFLAREIINAECTVDVRSMTWVLSDAARFAKVSRTLVEMAVDVLRWGGSISICGDDALAVQDVARGLREASARLEGAQ
jgi:hypothetical protein